MTSASESDRPRRSRERRVGKVQRPATLFDPMTQHERTSLAWERTAVAVMVAGVLLARHASRWSPVAAGVGVLQVVAGAAVLVWSGRHYDDLHGPLREGRSPVHPSAARVVGVAATAFTGFATLVAVVVALRPAS